MKEKTKLILEICIGIAIVGLAWGCFILFGENSSLTPEQQEAYAEVVEYAENTPNTQDILSEVKKDIVKVKTAELLENEVKIGKLKIDIINVQEQTNNEIEDKKIEAIENKGFYKSKMYSIINKYSGTEREYLSKKSKWEAYISSAYASYCAEVSKINSLNIGTGAKERYISQKYSEYISTIKPYQMQIEMLETRWKNRQEYEKYKALFDNVDKKLEQDINALNEKSKNDIEKLTNQIEVLKKNRTKKG